MKKYSELQPQSEEADYLSEDEVKKLENYADSSSVPQLWSPDGGKPMSISEIVKHRGLANNKKGKYRPKSWKAVSMSSLVNRSDFGKINHSED